MPIADDVEMGTDVRIFQPTLVNLYGCTLGAGTTVGPFVEIQQGVRIGRLCKISSHSFICSGVTIEDEVFVGHGVMFTNTVVPRATNADGMLQTEADWTLEKTVIGDDASIGSGSVILCGITIGAGAMIGAGAVVTKSVPAGEIWVGNPARFLRRVAD